MRDEGFLLGGGQDPNPEHEPPPKFGPRARAWIRCRTPSLEAAGKASGRLEPKKSRKVSLFDSSKPRRLGGSQEGPGWTLHGWSSA
jgi:hypothetical protein